MYLKKGVAAIKPGHPNGIPRSSAMRTRRMQEILTIPKPMHVPKGTPFHKSSNPSLIESIRLKCTCCSANS